MRHRLWYDNLSAHKSIYGRLGGIECMDWDGIQEAMINSACDASVPVVDALSNPLTHSLTHWLTHSLTTMPHTADSLADPPGGGGPTLHSHTPSLIH